MRLIANRQLTGDYGRVHAGEEFDAREDVAQDLLRRSLVRRPDPPRVEYETKVIRPEAPEVSARQQPFRHVPVSDEESEEVAPASDRVLRESDVSASGTDDPGGRAKGARSGARK